MVPEFEGFEDRLTTFQLLKGKKTGNLIDDEKNKVGLFKVNVRALRWSSVIAVLNINGTLVNE